MRVLLNLDDDRDHGAVAVIVALLSVVIFGLAAFAVDFGMAYTSKRNLQKGADAAALSAAKEVIQRSAVTSSCSEIVSRYNANTDGFATQVGTAADTYSTANRKDATRQLLELRCSSDGKRVEVVYEARGTTPTLFGGIFGQNTDYVAARRAVADVFVPSSASGLRPYFVCISDLSNLQSGTLTEIRYEKDSAPCGEFPGNWYTANCPLFQGNGDLADYTRDGCAEEIKIIEPLPPGLSVTQAQVVQECSPNLQTKTPSGCLVSNPGNIVSGNVISDTGVVGAWEYLLTLPGIAVPIFNSQWKTWADDANTVDCKTKGKGANGCYPVQAIAGVKVCGYKWNNKEGISPDYADSASPCFGVDLKVNAANGNENYLWLKLISVQLTGSSKPSSCGVGDDGCDAGARGTRLVE